MTTTSWVPRELQSEAQYLKGIGPKWANLLSKAGIKTIQDALYVVPRRYEDRRNLPPISKAQPGEHATIRGRITSVSTRSTRGGKVLLKAIVDDGTGQIMLTWFNQPWIKTKLQKASSDVIAFGLVKQADFALEMSSPEFELLEEDDDAADFTRIVPVYPLTEGLPQSIARKAARSAVNDYLKLVPDPLPEKVRAQEKLPGLQWSIKQLHIPEGEAERVRARQRLVFDEFLAMQLALQSRRNQVKQETGIAFDIDAITAGVSAGEHLFADRAPIPVWDEIHKMLPFELTAAQKRVIGEIFSDMKRPYPMNRLVQGDVGSGKTAVAASAMLAAVRCGYQATLMAPTEILAEQHYINLHRLFEPLGIEVALLVGKQGARAREKNRNKTAGGTAGVAIGTHALIQDGVDFHKLGLVVVDEQHRFGVLQRAALRAKGYGNPDVLVMTATPIPRTLTMTIYGDLDVSIIDELPPGRRPIKTHWKLPHERALVYRGVDDLLDKGHQAYFVCPMISESEKMQTQAAEDLCYRLQTQVFPNRKDRIGLLHGQMKSADKEEVMDRFRRHELDVLVSTTVIEVGVDVPNATAMVVEDANRFGLSQLHQLRGRVGRGGHQSYCILIADATNDDARTRMQTLVETTDGFKISEVDLRLRGPGEVAGTRQHGNLDFRIADLVQDVKLLEQARQVAMRILEIDPALASPENALLKKLMAQSPGDKALVTIS
ncbi:MAG: ATP-dependent DNA helicase RecG [Fimbriimonadaceae bacterium]|nr:ATP-dependent DNA helicase RecG [Fimbriimonadaceae bacterium]